jgi:hypothetical protein
MILTTIKENGPRAIFLRRKNNDKKTKSVVVARALQEVLS